MNWSSGSKWSSVDLLEFKSDDFPVALEAAGEGGHSLGATIEMTHVTTPPLVANDVEDPAAWQAQKSSCASWGHELWKHEAHHEAEQQHRSFTPDAGGNGTGAADCDDGDSLFL